MWFSQLQLDEIGILGANNLCQTFLLLWNVMQNYGEREWEMRCRGEADLSGWNSNIVRQTRVAREGVKNVMKCYDWDGLGLKESGQKMFGKRRSDKMYSCCNFDVKPTLPLITHWKWHSRQHKVAFWGRIDPSKIWIALQDGQVLARSHYQG